MHLADSSGLYSSGHKNERHELLQYGLLGVDRVAVRWCPHRSGIIREPQRSVKSGFFRVNVADPWYDKIPTR